MPKPFANLTGNGLPLPHSSLWDGDGAELFFDPADPRGLGLSPLAYHFIGGLIDHATALVGVTCPTVNSYKRMGVGAPHSGATWAPAYVTYGGNNRTQMLRVPEGGRVENRACDGSANPYLAMAVRSPRGWTGSTRRWTRASPTSTTSTCCRRRRSRARGIRTMPPTLLQAMDELVGDDVLRDALGKSPTGTTSTTSPRSSGEEFLAWHAVVSDWEVERYLTLF